MKRTLLIAFVFIASLFGADRALAQCNASFTWSQTYANEIDFVSTSTNFFSGGTLYMWNYGDNNSGWSNGSNTISHTYQNPGTYLVCLTMYDTVFNCTSTFCDSVTVTGTPIASSCNADFAVYMDSVNLNLAYIFDQSTASPSAQYLWIWGDNTYDTIHYPTHVYATTGSYNVCLVLNDTASFCTDTMCQVLIVARLTQEAMNVPFYVNVVGGGPLGITLPEIATVSVYPNPATDILTVEMKHVSEISLVNMLGETVYAQQTTSNASTRLQINTSTYARGIYFLRVNTDKGVQVKKVELR